MNGVRGRQKMKRIHIAKKGDEWAGRTGQVVSRVNGQIQEVGRQYQIPPGDRLAGTAVI